MNTPLLGLSRQRLSEELASLGEKPYRCSQVLEWVYRQSAKSFPEMTNLSKELRSMLAQRFCVYSSSIVAERSSSDATRKFLLRWADEETSECVIIPDGERRTVCVSTQVGCPVGCAFCASGIGGLSRNLTAGEIVEQAMQAQQLCRPDAAITNVVLMGLGEPLANYDNTIEAVRIINADWGMNIGARRITVSTVGIPHRIRQLAAEGLQITLALSLHAATDDLRVQLVPWAKTTPIRELIDACRDYFDATGREVTVEYVLLGGVNDSADCALSLASLCRQLRCNVNLIRYNPVPGLAYTRPNSEASQVFLTILREEGVNAHLRRSRGLDVEGACGQLRRREAARSD